jgi:biopolymer transport protein ExbD
MSVELKKGTATSFLNLTPMIDVVFLLLIFFLVATRFAEEERKLEVVLPSASEAMPMTVEPRQLIINIDDQGNYFVEGNRLNLEDLDQVLERATVNNPLNQTVNIRADKRVPFDAVVQILDLCKRYAVENYSIDTE